MSLIQMYVYFDLKGEIKAITPLVDRSLEQFHYAMLPLKDVELFLTGQKNPFDYQVKEIKGIVSTTFKIVKKEVAAPVLRGISGYLTEVTPLRPEDSTITFRVSSKDRTVRIYLNPEVSKIYQDETSEDREYLEKVAQPVPSFVYITERGNPYNLMGSVSFIPLELFSKGSIDVSLPDKIDFRDVSFYTKKLIKGYSLVMLKD